MTIIELSKYGEVLTGREFGKTVTQTLLERVEFPVALDFNGVVSMGSSFGEELLPAIAAKQGGAVRVRRVNIVVRNCIAGIEKEKGITVQFEA